MADISSITLPGGGTYDLKDKNAVPRYGMGKNLLDNWYFGNPVNQRGQSSYSGAVYGIDRWFGGLSTSSMTVNPDSISFSAGFWNQYFDLKRIQVGKTYTLSVYFKSGNFYTISGAIPSATSSQQTVMTMVLDSGHVSIIIPTNGKDYVRFAGENLNICSVKLELGPEQTLAHQENGTWILNEIPDYEYELYRCIISTADPSDTYANKSLATEQQLSGKASIDEIGIVVNGNSSTQGAAIGQYVILRNSTITGKTDGIYKAAKTIPVNTAIDGTYLSAMTSGALNDATAIVAYPFVANTTYIGEDTIVARRSGNVLTITGYVWTASSFPGSNALLGTFTGLTLESDTDIVCIGRYNNSMGPYTFRLKQNGQLITATGSNNFTGALYVPNAAIVI